MTDWTTVLVAVVSAAGGFGAAWLSSRVALRAAEAENKRLKIQHDEEHLRNRQGTYHRYLDKLEQFESFGAERLPNTEEFEAWRREFEFLQVGVELFGEDEVTARTRDLRVALVALTEAMEERRNLDEIEALHDAQVAARNEVLAAMRRDVRP